ncbi:MAG TPA: hypothetical protein PK263_00785 [bacterium]|nr:hypothetical protein [bacterium]
MTETLIQILIVAAIIAIVFLCVVLSRLYQILSDVKETTDIVSVRVRKTDAAIEKTANSIEGYVQAVQGFLYSFEIVKFVKNKIDEMKKKGDSDVK